MSELKRGMMLDTGVGVRAMTGIMATLLFLTLIATATGLATAAASRRFGTDMAGRLTVQVADSDAARRDATAARAAAGLAHVPGVVRVSVVDRTALTRRLSLALGGAAADVPVPAMIDVAFMGSPARVRSALARVGPGVRVDEARLDISPIAALFDTVTVLATALVGLIAGAAAVMVAAAARGGLEAQRATIDVMHMLGATDAQLAWLFQGRLARDAAFGAVIASGAAVAVVLFVARQTAQLGSELLRPAFGFDDWVLFALVPPGFVGLVAIVARVAVLRSLRQRW